MQLRSTAGRRRSAVRSGVSPRDAALIGRSGERLLDAAVFAGNLNPVRDVMVGGRFVVEDRVHAAEETVLTRFKAAIAELAS